MAATVAVEVKEVVRVKTIRSISDFFSHNTGDSGGYGGGNQSSGGM